MTALRWKTPAQQLTRSGWKNISGQRLDVTTVVGLTLVGNAATGPFIAVELPHFWRLMANVYQSQAPLRLEATP